VMAFGVTNLRVVLVPYPPNSEQRSFFAKARRRSLRGREPWHYGFSAPIRGLRNLSRLAKWRCEEGIMMYNSDAALIWAGQASEQQ